MDETELYGYIAKNSIISIFVVGIFLLAAYFIYEFILAIPYIISLLYGMVDYMHIGVLIPTMIIMGYIFRSIYNIRWFIISFIYGTVMYLLGDSIGMLMLFIGILFTVIILSGEITSTSILTYIDVKEWIQSDINREEDEKRRKEWEQLQAIKP